jgi:hypothetical protein
MLNTLLNIIITILAVILGFFILIRGKRYLWATAGVIMTIASANLLAILVARLDNAWELIELGRWQLTLIALGIGLVGVLLGRYKPDIASLIVGFLACADIALWFSDILVYLFDSIAGLPGNISLWIGIGLLFIGGIPGLYLTRRYPRRAIIVISVLVGVQIINLALGLSPTSSFSAVVLLSLTLLGVVVQYAEYARSMNKAAPFSGHISPVDEGLSIED